MKLFSLAISTAVAVGSSAGTKPLRGSEQRAEDMERALRLRGGTNTNKNQDNEYHPLFLAGGSGSDTTNSNGGGSFDSIIMDNEEVLFGGGGQDIGGKVIYRVPDFLTDLPPTVPTGPSSCLSGHDPVNKNGQDFCGDDEVIECGVTFDNEKVVLSHDLFCTENVLYDATDDELMELNAAITLSGPEASIDCKGHTIRQISHGPGSFCQVGLGIGNPFEPSDYRKEMKKNCYNFYQAGILLINGATAINCNVERFHDGFLVLNGGEVKKSETSGNVHGVFIQDLTGSIETTVSDVYAHDNAYGINVRNNDSSNSVTIEDVTCKLSYVGMALKGPDILVRDSTTSHNFLFGISSVGPFETDIEPDYTTKIQFEGKVSSHHNDYGIEFSYLELDFGGNKNAEIIVKGDVNTYLNRRIGLHVNVTTNTFYNVLFTVEEKGSWTSCQNSEMDIVNNNGSFSFNDEGSDGDGYICGTSAEYFNGQGLPTCIACPACDVLLVPSSNPSTSTQPSERVSLVPSMSRTLVPSDQPSEQPSNAPSSCSTSTTVNDFKNLLLSVSVSGSDAINDESSPQGKALYWISCEDCIDPPLQPGIDDAQIIQRYILAVFYYATNGPHWFDDFPDDGTFDVPDEYWMSTCDDECDDNWYGMRWGGVRCNEDREIIGLWLYRILISSGQIPTELGLLTSLEQISLSVNGLTGSIPTELGSLTNLMQLGLSGNELNGSIPTEIGLLENLEQMSLSFNGLSGSIPTELGSLNNLKNLNLNNNELNGSIPTEISLLENLWWLEFGNNQLTGSVPTELGSMTSLKHLYAYSNSLSGSIPTELGQLEMDYLWLYDNALEGTIPTELSEMNFSLKLQGNDLLVGSIPAAICNKGLFQLEADCDICDASQDGCCTIKHGCP